MSKKANLIGLTVVATAMAATGMAWAQVSPAGGLSPANQLVPAARPQMAVAPAARPQMAVAPAARPQTAVAPAAPLGGATVAAAPGLGQAPAMPQAVTPISADVSAGAPSAESDAVHRNTLRIINEKKAELALLEMQAQIDKFKKPQEDAARKEESTNLQSALEQAKKDQNPSSSTGGAAMEQSTPVTLLATFAMPEYPQSGYAELKVGDMLVHAKLGDRLPSGHYVKAINFDSVELSKNKAAKKGQVIFISSTDTASVYGSRAKSGVSVESGAAAPGGVGTATQPAAMATMPSGLPPMPNAR